VDEIKEFLMNARKSDASHMVIFRPKKSNSKITKFKLRTKKYLYTLVVRDSQKAKKIEESLPPTLKVTKINPKKVPAKKK
jgi:large subunit ribosomal protein L38e